MTVTFYIVYQNLPKNKICRNELDFVINRWRCLTVHCRLFLLTIENVNFCKNFRLLRT